MNFFIFVCVFILGVYQINAVLQPIIYNLPLNLGITEPKPGNIWPKPHKQQSSTTQYTIDKSKFHFTTNALSCDIIKGAIDRYNSLIFIDKHSSKAPNHSLIEEVKVEVSDLSCGFPTHDADETYTIHVPAHGAPHQISINSKTVWGALRAFETLSQIVYANDEHHLFLNQTEIEDAPRYKYRGLLLDTARHYLPKKIILANLDAMAYNKFNVFHWHLVDDQSFPFVSKQYPNLSKKGAYTEKHVYSTDVINEVISYARMRGIRVIPELDSPGHTHALAKAFPDLLTPCYKNGKSHQANYPHYDATEVLNPMKNETYSIMKNLYSEFKSIFKDQYIHLGMDEVMYSCWKSSPEISQFMVKHGMKAYHEVEEYYVKLTLSNVKEVGYKYLIWQDPVDNGVKLAPDSIVGVWKDKHLDPSMDLWQNYISKVAKKNYSIILSACFYLNYITTPYPGKDWETFYQCDPRNFTGTEAEKNLVIGGQANVWGEFVDQTNILSRLWPRASAVAERLWSDAAQTKDIQTARFRLDMQRCRMLRRGIPAAPILNGYCGDWEIPDDEGELVNAAQIVKL